MTRAVAWPRGRRATRVRTSLRRVVFLPSHPASLKEMLLLGEDLAAGSRYGCRFVIDFNCPAHWHEQIRAAGHEVIGSASLCTASSSPAAQTAPPKCQGSQNGFWKEFAPLRSLRNGWYASPIGVATRYARYRRKFRQAIDRADALLDKARPDLLIMPSDRLVGLETALVVRGRMRGIPSVVLPWALSDIKAVAMQRRMNPDWEFTFGMKRWVNRRVAEEFPGMVIPCEDGQPMLFLSGEAVLAAHREGILNPYPLAVGGGLADRVAVESPRTGQQIEELGVDPQRIVTTGRVSSDRVYRVLLAQGEYRTAFCQKHQLDPRRPILLCAVPQYGEHRLTSWQRHWEEIEWLLGTLRSVDNAQVVLSLHPKSNPADYQAVAQRHAAIIADEPIERLVPICHALVGGFTSTAVMAMGCGKPVVVLDILEQRLSIFDGCPGIAVVQRREEAQPTLKRLFSCPAYYDTLVEGHRQTADDWIRLDGRSAERTLALFDDLCP